MLQRGSWSVAERGIIPVDKAWFINQVGRKARRHWNCWRELTDTVKGDDDERKVAVARGTDYRSPRRSLFCFLVSLRLSLSLFERDGQELQKDERKTSSMKTLLAVDGSENANEALRLLKYLSIDHLFVLHASMCPSRLPMMVPEVAEELYREVERSMREDGDDCSIGLSPPSVPHGTCHKNSPGRIAG